MDNQKPEKTNLTVTGGLIVVALLMSVLFVAQLPLKSSRPVFQGHDGFLYRSEDISARLWEDPFAPVQKDPKSKKKIHIDRAGDHRIQSLADQIKGKEENPVTALNIWALSGYLLKAKAQMCHAG